MYREAWYAAVHGVTKSWTQLSDRTELNWYMHCFHCSVAKLCLILCNLMDCSMPGGPDCPSLSPRACSNSFPLSQWGHPTISSSVAPFSSIYMYIYTHTHIYIYITYTYIYTYTLCIYTHMGILSVFHFIALYKYYIFHRLKFCSNYIKQVYQCHFSNSICSLPVSVLYVDHSHNISTFFIIILFVYGDLWSVNFLQNDDSTHPFNKDDSNHSDGG